jgi:hypothetical protein
MLIRKSKIESEIKNISSEYQEEAPPLASMDEFLSTIKRNYRIESLGSFIHWIQLVGKTPRMSIKQWNDKLNEFMTRKV